MPKFEVVKMTTMNRSTLKAEYDVISRHKTREAAVRKISKLAGKEQVERWPHRPEMVTVIEDEYEIREVAASA